MSDDILPEWFRPYAFERAGFLGWRIMFEGDEISLVYGFDAASKTTAMLNGAYNMGYSRAQMDATSNDNSPS